jgi:uncharacterized DUF497 family protein
MALTFERDPRKAVKNLENHGMAFEEARTAFADPLGRIVDDPRHSAFEERAVLIGKTERGRLVAVMFTERADTIRIFSARLVTRRERIDYEEGHVQGKERGHDALPASRPG